MPKCPLFHAHHLASSLARAHSPAKRKRPDYAFFSTLTKGEAVPVRGTRLAATLRGKFRSWINGPYPPALPNEPCQPLSGYVRESALEAVPDEDGNIFI